MSEVKFKEIYRSHGSSIEEIDENEIREEGWSVEVQGGAVDDDITVTLCIGKEIRDGDKYSCNYINASLTEAECRHLINELTDVLECLKED